MQNTSLILFFFLLVSLNAVAASAAPAKKKSAMIVELTGGMHLQSFDYVEDIPAPDKSIESGRFLLFAAGIKVSGPQLAGFKSHFRGVFEYASQVATDYEGTILGQSGTPANATDYHNFIRIEPSYYFGIHPNFAIHAGYGYRYWKRSLDYGSGYLETYTWSYLPIGIYLQNEFGPLSLGVDLTYLVMMSGDIDIVFSENLVGGQDTKLTLGNKNGYRVAFPIAYVVNDLITVDAKPWYEFTEIGRSDQKFNGTPTINQNIHEPASVTKQMGVYLGLSIRVL